MASDSYDFIIVGGGTAGLTVASRLSEDPSQRVLVLEAGDDAHEDPRIKTPALWLSLLGSDVDWNFRSEPQPLLNDRVIGLNQGKVLGGSSATNAQVFVPPVPAIIDHWEHTLGNAGWNWETLRPYLAKAYTSPPFDKSTAETLGIDGWTKTSTTHGPVRTAFSGDQSHPVRKIWADTFRATGHYMTQDPFTGSSVGGFTSLASIDPTTGERCSSAIAYYYPIKGRENLHVITNATVEKVLLSGQGSDHTTVKATGVLYRHGDETKQVTCDKEVVLAAGALQSPKLLELSGIGDASFLKQHEIDPIIDLPGVGENLYDHIFCAISFAAVDELDTLDAIIRQEPDALADAAKRYAEDGSGPFSSMGVYSYAYLPVLGHASPDGRRKLIEMLEEARPTEGGTPEHKRARAYYEIAKTSLLDPGQPSCAYLAFIAQFVGSFESNTKSFTMNAMHSQPLSRGSVHIQSNDIAMMPKVDPRYLSSQLDLEIFAENLLQIETIIRTAPLSNLVKQPVVHRDPASNLTDLETAKNWIRKNGDSMWHYGGSCAMLAKEMNGVVDHRLKIYGVQNLRVVDASAIPVISTANLQATVYAFAERAADLIKEDSGMSSGSA
ncbi:putative GMC oxidoreductase [Xylariaceae sp. FL1019]|nr:putative GMC oxidoreductase [Xylariaceae sp. FL1019]